MADLYAGKTHQLIRSYSRAVDMTLIVSWRTKNRDGELMQWYLFSMSPRQQSKYGSQTRPKFIKGRIYEVERSDGNFVYVKRTREKTGWYDERILWLKQVTKEAFLDQEGVQE